MKIFLVLLIITGSAFAQGSDTSDANAEKISFETEWDLYYTNAGFYIPFTGTGIPEMGSAGEWEVYSKLFLNSFIPRFLVIEASVNPMPVAGILTRKASEDFYGRAKVNNNLNLIQAITAGFDEPYAGSIFLGNVVSFLQPGEEEKSGNLGYMGYLFNIGNYHIRNNRLVDDIWYELEWKVKGNRIFSTHSHSWNFRLGTKQHSNENITDVIYLSFKRDRLDFSSSFFSVFENSGFEYTFYFDYKKMRHVKHVFYVEKKWPLTSIKAALTFAIGFIWEADYRYSGPLAYNEGRDNFIIITRPNIQF